MAKKKKPVEPEEELRREEFDNEITRQPRAKKHPHERITEVGMDERLYETEELEEQGQTDNGLSNPNANDELDRAIRNPTSGRKIA